MTNHYLQAIDQNTKAFGEAFGHLAPEQLNWKPNAQTWSIGQNIDHLIVINSSYFPVIESVRKGGYKTPWFGKIGFIANFFGKMILNASSPDRRKKMQTFSIWEPAESNVSPDILKQFEQHHEQLKQLIQENHDLAEKGVVIPSPANSNIVYKLSKAFEIIVTHEQRHLEQAKEVLPLLP